MSAARASCNNAGRQLVVWIPTASAYRRPVCWVMKPQRKVKKNLEEKLAIKAPAVAMQSEGLF